jgi:hypothetical protein
LLVLSIAANASAQSESTPYVRKNSFGVLFAYSNDSSHILFGQAEQRKLLNIGVSYSRKLIAGRIVNFQFDAELVPVALESDPLSRVVIEQTSPTKVTTIINGDPPISCTPYSFSISYVKDGVTYTNDVSFMCHGRQWTMGTAMSPAGLRLNFLTRHKLQPVIESHGGYMFSSRPIPLSEAGSFNFTVDAGVGFEYFRTHSQSLRVEYRYHHTSNHDTADFNPGIDNSLFHIAYVFGR